METGMKSFKVHHWENFDGFNIDLGKISEATMNFVLFDYLRPINNLSVMCWTSTKLGLMFLLKDARQWRRWGLNPHSLGLESSTIPLSHCIPDTMNWYE